MNMGTVRAEVIPLPIGRPSKRRVRSITVRREAKAVRIEPQIEAAAPVPAAMTAKAATFRVLEAVDRTVGDPASGIRRVLLALAAGPFSSPRIEAKVARLVAGFGERARIKLRNWDYPGVRLELRGLCDRLGTLDPAIIDQLLRNAGVIVQANERDSGKRSEGAFL
jgi:hypothetical protein